MHAAVLFGSLGLLPFLAWFAHLMWPEAKVLGADPGGTYVFYC